MNAIYQIIDPQMDFPEYAEREQDIDEGERVLKLYPAWDGTFVTIPGASRFVKVNGELVLVND